MHTDPNHDIKKKLLIIPVIAIASVSLTTMLVTLALMYGNLPEDVTIPYQTILLSNFALIMLFGIATYLVMKKTFIVRLDRLQKGIFGFLDFLSGKTDQIRYIEKDTGAMSDAINEKMRTIEKQRQQDQAFIEEFILHAKAVENGDYTRRIKTVPSNPILQNAHDEINKMLESLEKNIGKDLNVILKTINAYASEDYRQQLQNSEGAIEKAIQKLGQVISTMLHDDHTHGSEFREKAKTVNQNIHSAYKSINQNLKQELDVIVETIDDVTTHIKKNVESASFISSYTQTVQNAAREGESLAEQTALAMSEISSQVDTINEAISMIDKITMQTNILSLNAAVEASTAGEAGKGFAVVAQEVRNLAAQTAKASKEIKHIVEDAKAKAEYGTTISANMIEGYHQLVQAVSKTMDIVYSITQSSNQQDEKIQKIHRLVYQMQSLIQSCLMELDTAKQHSDENFHRAEKIVQMTENKKFEFSTHS